MRLPRVLARDSLGALVLVLAIPFLFLDERHQPERLIDVGSTQVHARLSDAAVVAVLLAAIAALLRWGAWRLTAARILWVPGVLLLAWLGFQTFRPGSIDGPNFDANVVSYVELIEYALIAVAVPLLVRRALDLGIVVAGLVLWSVAATAVGLAQFAGVDVLDAGPAGDRQASFLTFHDLAALSALAFAVGIAGIVATRRRMPARQLVPVAVLAGGLGLVVSGSFVAVAGLAVGALLALIAARGRFAPSGGRLAGLAALLAIVLIGVTAVRTEATERAAESLGAAEREAVTGPSREALAYLGLRLFQDNAVLGAGWQRSSEYELVAPYIADARERYPDEPAEAFPASERELSLSSLYVQLLAEAGVAGLVLLVGLGIGGLVLCWRTATYASSPWAAGAGLAMMCALVGLAGEWALVGLLPGIPLQSATALALGLAAAGAATVEEETGG